MTPTPLYSASGSKLASVVLPRPLPQVVTHGCWIFVLDDDGRYVEATHYREPQIARDGKGDRI